jgi:hypothetical protein
MKILKLNKYHQICNRILSKISQIYDTIFILLAYLIRWVDPVKISPDPVPDPDPEKSRIRYRIRIQKFLRSGSGSTAGSKHIDHRTKSYSQKNFSGEKSMSNFEFFNL